tara:strand:+ start:138 stop:332 length:195 start_codon:yes stop_codon:yes gene_type:complete
MIIKANKKFNNLQPQAIPCSVSNRKALQKGQSVDVEEEVANALLAMNVVVKVTNKKNKKSKEKK